MLLLAKLRRLISVHRCAGCMVCFWLVLLHPFISAHFHSDGLEDEPGLKVRNASETVRFEPDDRTGHAADLETTLFAQASAGMAAVNALSAAFEGFMVLVLLLVPLIVAPVVLVAATACERPRHVDVRSGAPPPPALPWLPLPPKTAPPSIA